MWNFSFLKFIKIPSLAIISLSPVPRSSKKINFIDFFHLTFRCVAWNVLNKFYLSLSRVHPIGVFKSLPRQPISKFWISLQPLGHVTSLRKFHNLVLIFFLPSTRVHNFELDRENFFSGLLIKILINKKCFFKRIVPCGEFQNWFQLVFTRTSWFA